MKSIVKLSERIYAGRRLHAVLLAAVMLAAAASAGCGGADLNTSTGSGQFSLLSPAPAEAAAISLYDEDSVVALYERSIPAVVQIDMAGSIKLDALERLDLPVPQLRGQGSGFIIDDEGHILTNYHVVDNAGKVKVTLHDGTELTAKVGGTDPNNDLALISVDPEKLGDILPLPLGDSDAIKPGQMAIALGSPYGLEGSITVGVISGLKRSITGKTQRPIADMIQTDAAINPGNSGGPLLNSRGEVIGINTAIEAFANGIGYAVPINTARSVLPALLDGKEVRSAWLGVSGTAVTDELKEKLGLTVDEGVYVIGVMPDSPAQEAGIREGGRNQQGEPTSGGDVIIEVDGVAVSEVEDLIRYFNSKRPGDEVSLLIVRDGREMTVGVQLDEWPEDIAVSGYRIQPKEFDFGPFHWFWDWDSRQ
jgi:S1-C subfamily serine protease